MPGRDTTAAMQEFVERHGLEDMPQAVDEDGQLWSRFGVAYQPAWVFIDTDGSVEVVAGALAGSGLDDALGELTS